MPTASNLVTVDAGTIPFGILDLLGCATTALPGSWAPVVVPAEQVGESRWGFHARGRADGRPIELRILVRAYHDRVWAVGVHSEPYLFRLDGDGDRRFLVAVPRPPRMPTDEVNWIAIGDQGPYDLGVAA